MFRCRQCVEDPFGAIFGTAGDHRRRQRHGGRRGTTRTLEESTDGYRPRQGVELDDLVRRWIEHVHPRAR
ncbi:hypothetical protein FOZ60_016189, partial [Perkinsus olseni]